MKFPSAGRLDLLKMNIPHTQNNVRPPQWTNGCKNRSTNAYTGLFLQSECVCDATFDEKAQSESRSDVRLRNDSGIGTD